LEYVLSTAIAVIIVFGCLIFVHELGHFLVARAFGIGVQTLSLGFGPRLFGWRGKKTDYRISLVPLGGYVALVGERDGELPEGFSKRESFSERSPYQRFLVIVAGAVFNIILAWVIFCAGAFMSGKPLVLPDGSMPHTVQLGMVQDGSPADKAELASGDMVLEVNGIPVTNIEQMPKAVAESQGHEILITVERKGELLSKTIVPRLDQSEGAAVYRIGVQLMAVPEMVPVGFFESFHLGSQATIKATSFIIDALVKLVSGQESVKNLGGPIQIAREISNASDSGIQMVLIFMALLSVNLGLLNLLPIPVLDGGHALFLIVEMVARRPLPESVRTATGYIGLFFLIGIMVVATYNDILRLIS
jgi:regulator of sigma E protease